MMSTNFSQLSAEDRGYARNLQKILTMGMYKTNVMDSYTLVLTRGTHVVTREAGESILAALGSNTKYVTVDIDMLGDGVIHAGVHIATAHVVAIVPSDDVDSDEIQFAPNVSSIQVARDARLRL